MRGRRRSLNRDQIVLAEGEAPRSLYFIMSGSVAVRLTNWHGHEVLLAYMHAGDFFGEMCLFPDVTSRSAMVQALGDCLVLEIAYPTFMELASRHSSLWLELAGQLAERLRVTNRRLAELPVMPAAERIWTVLIDLARHAERRDSDMVVALRVTRRDLGRLAGCSREVAGAVLLDFERLGRLQLTGHRILVPVAALQTIPAVAGAETRISTRDLGPGATGTLPDLRLGD